MKCVSGQFQRKNEWVLRYMMNENNGHFKYHTPVYIHGSACFASRLHEIEVHNMEKKQKRKQEKKQKQNCAVWHPEIWD